MPLKFHPLQAIKNAVSNIFGPKSKAPKPAEAVVVICRGCHKSFMPPLRLPVMICPWCGIPNF